MANLMFGRNAHLGRHRFAAPKRIGGVAIDYPYIDGHFAVDFYSAGGIRTATLVSDRTDSPVISAEFELNQNGCAQFKLVLNKAHGITIAYNQRIDIRLFGDTQPWYSGYVQVRPIEGTTAETLEYSGYGFYQQCEGVIVNGTYSNKEISQIVRSIVRDYIEPKTGALLALDKIYSTGYTATGLKFDHVTAKDALSQLAEFAANYIHGVDETRDVFFKPLITKINENSRFWVGHHIEKFLPEEDVETVVNYIYVQGGDSTVVYETSDAASIAAYGMRGAVLTIPSAVEDVDAQRWGNSQLAALKDPQRTAKVDGIKPDILKRKIKPEGMARITTYDGSSHYDYTIQKCKYKISSAGITMTMELGEYTKGLGEYILKLTRDVKNAELLQRMSSAI
mgnify:CR=1 FL=1